jgi:hypothetical protein
MFMSYNLTDSQKDLAKWFVEKVRNKVLPEEFYVVWLNDTGRIIDFKGEHPIVTKGMLDALSAADLLICVPDYKTTTSQSGSRAHPNLSYQQREVNRRCTLTGKSYEAVNSNFKAPDTSFVTHLTPLADITKLDSEIKSRCLPILGAGSADPKLWDSAVRTAGVILEERLRSIGGISDSSIIGQELVNKIFGNGGILATKSSLSTQRQAYRDLYSGIVGVFRNPSAHRLIDPTPEDGGAFIVFINLLLKMLEDLR